MKMASEAEKIHRKYLCIDCYVEDGFYLCLHHCPCLPSHPYLPSDHVLLQHTVEKTLLGSEKKKSVSGRRTGALKSPLKKEITRPGILT